MFKYKPDHEKVEIMKWVMFGCLGKSLNDPELNNCHFFVSPFTSGIQESSITNTFEILFNAGI